MALTHFAVDKMMYPLCNKIINKSKEMCCFFFLILSANEMNLAESIILIRKRHFTVNHINLIIKHCDIYYSIQVVNYGRKNERNWHIKSTNLSSFVEIDEYKKRRRIATYNEFAANDNIHFSLASLFGLWIKVFITLFFAIAHYFFFLFRFGQWRT